MTKTCPVRLLQKNKTTSALKKIEIASLIPFAFYWIYWFSPHSINLGGQGEIERSRCLPAAAEFALCGLSSRSFTYWKQLKPLCLVRSEASRSRDRVWKDTFPVLCCRKGNSAYNICRMHCGYLGSFLWMRVFTSFPQTVRELWLFKWTLSPTSCWKIETDSALRIEVFVIWEGMWFLSCFRLFPVLIHLIGVSSSLIFHEVKQNHLWGNLLTARISTVSYASWQKEGDWWENNEENSLFSWGVRF